MSDDLSAVTPALEKLIGDMAEEVRGYLREHLEDVVLVAQKGLEAIDASEIPVAVAERLFDEAAYIRRNTDHLVTYAEILEIGKET